MTPVAFSPPLSEFSQPAQQTLAASPRALEDPSYNHSQESLQGNSLLTAPKENQSTN